MIKAVTSGNFGEADARLSTILQLFERLGIRDAPTAPIARDIRRKRFTLHQELARAAHDFRIKKGRSRITDQQVQTERGWRRTMINTALEQPTAGQRIRDFVRAANSWAAYARQVFSRAQRSWPNRSLASRQTPGGEEFLEDGSYATPLLEDIALIKEKLATPQIQALVDENANRQGQMTRLSDGQRLAVESFSVLLEQDPDSVLLNQFVNLLSALHRLAVPAAQLALGRCSIQGDIVRRASLVLPFWSLILRVAHWARKAEHAIDLDSGATVAVTLQAADRATRQRPSTRRSRLPSKSRPRTRSPRALRPSTRSSLTRGATATRR